MQATEKQLIHFLRFGVKGLAVLVSALIATAAQASADSVQSTGVMKFIDNDTLVFADWRAGKLRALKLPPVSPAQSTGFNLKNASGQIARKLGVKSENLRFEDMAMRPGAELAYIALSVDRGGVRPQPALVSVDTTGKVAVVSLAKGRMTSATLRNPPSDDKKLWRDVPESTLTVTDIAHHEGKLYVAGLSNASFSSTLRIYDFPFKGEATLASVEMYHPVHNQTETRAPIRKMVIAILNGVPSLVAAFTCSPLVTIPLADLRDGAHISAKTIAEFGWGSMPLGMVSFDAGQGPVVLLTHSHKSADLVSVDAIAAASQLPGLNTPIEWPAKPLLGLKSTYIPLAGAAKLDNQDSVFLAALRRNDASGAMELVSIRKGAFLRLSDFVNEYDFADFRYGPTDGWKDVHRTLRTDEGFLDLAGRAGQ